MELTPDIVGRSTGHSGFADPWFDKDHDGDIVKGPPSAIVTQPRGPIRSVPPASFDSTFAMPLPSGVQTQSPAPALPAVARGRRGQDTLFSADWFHDASDAAEWRAVAEERRAEAAVASAAPSTSKVPIWLVGALVASTVMVGAAGTGVVAIAVSALVLLG